MERKFLICRWIGKFAVVGSAYGRALSSSYDWSVILWDVAHGTSLAAFVGDAAITCVAATPTRLLAGSANGVLHILRLCP